MNDDDNVFYASSCLVFERTATSLQVNSQLIVDDSVPRSDDKIYHIFELLLGFTLMAAAEFDVPPPPPPPQPPLPRLRVQAEPVPPREYDTRSRTGARSGTGAMAAHRRGQPVGGRNASRHVSPCLREKRGADSGQATRMTSEDAQHLPMRTDHTIIHEVASIQQTVSTQSISSDASDQLAESDLDHVSCEPCRSHWRVAARLKVLRADRMKMDDPSDPSSGDTSMSSIASDNFVGHPCLTSLTVKVTATRRHPGDRPTQSAERWRCRSRIKRTVPHQDRSSGRNHVDKVAGCERNDRQL